MKTIAVDMLNKMGYESKLKITSEDLKEVKDWKVGGKYKLQIEVTMTEAELEDDDCICAEFYVDKCKVM